MADEAAPLRYTRAAFTGTLLRVLPAQIETLEEVRELANEGLGGNVPHGCMDLLGQHGKLVRDTDLADCGPFVDVYKYTHDSFSDELQHPLGVHVCRSK